MPEDTPLTQASRSTHCPLLLQELREQCPSLPEKNSVRWVLTVPAIWKQPAKQFMREAAYLVRSARCSGGPQGWPHILIHPTTPGTTESLCRPPVFPSWAFWRVIATREGAGLQEQRAKGQRDSPSQLSQS